MHPPEHPPVSEMNLVVSKWQSEYLPTITKVAEEHRPSTMVSRISYRMIVYVHLPEHPLVSEMNIVVSNWQSEYFPTIAKVAEEDRPSLMMSGIL
jgi:hypothetical protein